MQNAYIERKNGSIRRELLNAYLFYSFNELKEKCEEWRLDYNTERPHKSLGHLSPIKYMEKRQPALSTPANKNHLQIEAQPVADKAADNKKKITFESGGYRTKLKTIHGDLKVLNNLLT